MKQHELENLTPIWSPEMGDRLKIARMKLKLSQGELAALLAITQSTVSKLECGVVQVALLPLSVLKFALTDHLTYVLWGSRESAYSPNYIIQEYWKRLKRGAKHVRFL